MHSYYNNPKSNAAALLNKDFIERYFMETYHWTPMEIDKLPYRWVQRYFTIENAKVMAQDVKRQVDDFKRQHGHKK